MGICLPFTIAAGNLSILQQLIEIKAKPLPGSSMKWVWSEVMDHRRIWVLITDGVCARICSSGDGNVALIAPPEDLVFDTNKCSPDDMARAWYRFNGGSGFLRGPKTQFAGHIAQILQEAAAEGAYEALIIIAAPQIAEELEHALDARTRALLIGDIVRDISLSRAQKCAPAMGVGSL
jgi:protein required for attachment to host cells